MVLASSARITPRNNARPALVQMLNLGIQRQLPGSILLEAAYLGNLSHHVATTSLESLNQLDYAKYGRLGSLLNADINSAQAISSGIRAPYAGFTGTVSVSPGKVSVSIPWRSAAVGTGNTWVVPNT